MESNKNKSNPKLNPDSKIDPLYTIFEQHLYNFDDNSTDRKVFVTNIVVEYLAHLRSLKVAIPKELEKSIIEELGIQVNSMLTKKIYGCLSIEDYRIGLTTPVKKKAQRKYRSLKKAEPVEGGFFKWARPKSRNRTTG